MNEEKETPWYEFFLLIGIAGVFIWLLYSYSIEPALVFATVISGIVWALYALFSRKSATKNAENNAQKEPLMVDYARSFFPIFLFVLLLRAFVVEPFRIPSGSMMPTLLVGDFILVNKFAYGLRAPITKTKFVEVSDPERGDVVVFRYPSNPRLDYIKRLVGLPGDRIAYKDKTLYVNGKAMPQTTIGAYEPVGSGERSRGSWEVKENLDGVEHSVLIDPRRPDFPPGCNKLARGEITVPQGHFFMMGDNRDNSNDSRCWGFVPEENLVGKAFMIWLSLDWNRSGIFDWSRVGEVIE
jgi:signal peptidase I